MAETILAGKEIEELSCNHGASLLAATYAKFPGLTKDLLMGNGPGNTGDGYCQCKKPDKLKRD